MKKNVFLKLASALLVLCLASTCAIGTTFAKYTTADKASDTARVAKWGITVAVSGTLFGTDYESNTAADAVKDRITATSTSVSSLDGKIVAPGTKNDVGFQVSITGTPEVQYKVTAGLNDKTISDIWLAKGTYAVMVVEYGVNADTDLSSLYVKDGATYKPATTYATGTVYYAAHDVVEVTEDKYYPIVWSVTDGTTPTTYTTLEAATTAMTTAFNAMGGNANVGINKTYTLTWAWPFEEGADDAAKALRNAKDTILGNLAANPASVVKLDGTNYVALTGAGTEYSLTINFGFNVTVNQVD